MGQLAVYELRMPDGAKDPSELLRLDPKNFAAKIRAAMAQAVAAALPPKAPAIGLHPSEIVLRWQQEGPLVRIPTGIADLDELCLGGLPVPWRVMIVGAPSAGKTFFEISMANTIARAAENAGLCVGILAVDEEPDDITIRLAQLAGFTIAEAEQRDGHVLSAMADALKSMRVRLYDSSQTIESAANDLAAWALAENRKAALFIDSIQAVSSEAAASSKGPRELVEANVKAMRWAHDHHGMLVVATVEANRASYRDDEAAESSNDMAAGAESRAIEFGAKTQLMLRTPKGHPDVVWCRVAKNRRAKKGEFWLAIDRESHSLLRCCNPKEAPEAAGKAMELKRSINIARIEADARELLKLMTRHPGAGSKKLRSEAKLAGLGWGVERLEAARERLVRGFDGHRVVDRSSKPGEHQWFVESCGQSEG